MQILPKARPAGRRAGLAFDRDVELVIAIGRGLRSRSDLVERAWHASAAEPAERVASRIDRRLGRARERLARVAFEHLRTTARMGTPRAVALACVFIDLGLKPEWVSDPAGSASV